MILYIFLFFIACIFFYYYNKKNMQKNMQKNIRKNIRESFISSNKFRGEKKGYVFKKDTKGLGYYVDMF